jgi:hypothetical protein
LSPAAWAIWTTTARTHGGGVLMVDPLHDVQAKTWLDDIETVNSGKPRPIEFAPSA